MRDIAMGSIRASLVTLVLCGIVYPVALVALGQGLFPQEANGSLEKAADGMVLGSRLIGQYWSGPEWFHGRPSATTPTPYNAANSGATNLGPASKGLAARLDANREAVVSIEPKFDGASFPADMLTTSGSGLDPDISPANAALQVERVARARHAPQAAIAALVAQHTSGRSLGLFGEPRVNVLSLNLALHRTFPIDR